jgi:ring-1,2-phenylacetyl-CoA epoxidase subunit PaaD
VSAEVLTRSTPPPDPTPWLAAEARAWEVLASVPDPELPILSVVDLGIIRNVNIAMDGTLRVGVSPTYSGCPATEFIRTNLISALRAAGFEHVTVAEELSPPWSSDCITVFGRQKLRAYGIAPPLQTLASLQQLVRPEATVECPRCGSGVTELISEFGSTPCKALHRCTSCLEPFDSFKCI